MRSSVRIALLAALSVLVACSRPRGSVEVPPAESSEVGDPTEIEGPEIGEEQTDNARAVEPGPAELEVGMPQGEPGTPSPPR